MLKKDDIYTLALPNKEIKQVFRREIRTRYIKNDQLSIVFKLKDAFEKGDSKALEKLFENYLLSTFSSFEFNSEKNYQILLSTTLSLIFDNAYVKNELNAGLRRADIIVCPKDNKKLGIVLESKYVKTRL